MAPSTVEDLRNAWTALYSKTLPSLAISKSPSQIHWSVHLDHCFARIIFDAVVGVDAPWTSKLTAPAVKNMSEKQLRNCILMGEGIANGEVNLMEADERSLEVRGKTGKEGKRGKSNGGKRKRDETGEIAATKEGGKAALEDRTSKKRKQTDIRTAMASITKCNFPSHSPPPPPSSTSPSPSPHRLSPPSSSSSPTPSQDPSPSLSGPLSTARSLIITSTLSPFRRRVLLTLLQVPRGHYTTYAALSSFLSSSPRAVGNAMRNNPFAPTVPCHRVLAADGSIGGFGGEWGEGGKFRGEKVKLLRAEGVRFDGRGRVVGAVWRGFV
ncbi:methylated-DNA--protein-cysteine methyltransferase [Lignoscripta atroalba]|nr:methylated-DNA--protein-cysteine methyltransferase [Lignoscripta atroalba]